MYIAPRTVAARVFDVWRSPGRFTRHPALVDHTNRGDAPATSHLVGVYLEPEDLY